MEENPNGADVWRSEILVSDAVGRLIEFWGFKRNMGRVWTVLYLSNRPLAAQDLRERLQLSAGAVSMVLADLGRWGVVRKVWVQGERRDHYEAEGNIWKMVSRVLGERERVEIHDAIDAFHDALDWLERKAEAATTDEERERAARQAERVADLLELARLGKQLLDRLLSQGRVDATPLLSVLLGRGGRR